MSDSTMPFVDQLIEAQVAKRSIVIAGLDPHPTLLPPDVIEEASDAPAIERACRAYRRFCFEILEAVEPEVVAVKPQIAFFELLGSAGIAVFEEVVHRARSLGLLVIGDLKRGDIGSTAEAYASAWLGGGTFSEQPLKRIELDALTINPYLGSDGIRPFLARAQERAHGLFILVRTSNPSSAELQELECDREGTLLYQRVGDLVAEWGRESLGAHGYSSVGAVVGATFPKSLSALRSRLPSVPFLLPGYGAQGGGIAAVEAGLDDRGLGAWVSASRSIAFAYRSAPVGTDWRTAAREAARAMRKELWRVRERRRRG